MDQFLDVNVYHGKELVAQTSKVLLVRFPLFQQIFKRLNLCDVCKDQMSVIVEDTDQVTEIMTKKIETRKSDVNNNVPLSKGVDSNSGTVKDTKQVKEITNKKTALNRTAAVTADVRKVVKPSRMFSRIKGAKRGRRATFVKKKFIKCKACKIKIRKSCFNKHKKSQIHVRNIAKSAVILLNRVDNNVDSLIDKLDEVKATTFDDNDHVDTEMEETVPATETLQDVDTEMEEIIQVTETLADDSDHVHEIIRKLDDAVDWFRNQTKSVKLKSGNYTSIIDQESDSEVDENYVYKDIK